MRNLKLLVENRNQLPIDEPILHFAVDSEKKDIYFVTESNILYGYKPHEQKLWLEFPLVQDELLPQEAQIDHIEYIPDLESVCVASREGDIVVYEVEAGRAECVGAIDSGITCMCWSPDYEIVVFTTGKNTLLLMTKDWDVIAENPVPLTDPSTTCSALPSVSWRGDGQFFATLFPHDKKEDGSIKIWDRSGSLHSNAEAVKILGRRVCWKPSGNLIASSQLSPQKHEIIFFERNGLRHGEFALRNKESTVLDLRWNSESDVLALLLQNPVTKTPTLQLWYVSNYYWYLKYEIAPESRIINFVWDQEDPMALRVVTSNGEYLEFNFCWEYQTTSSLTENNPTTIAVIDGSNVQLTPFRFLAVPPPMSAAVLNVNLVEKEAHYVNEVFFGPHCDLGVLTSSNRLAIYKNSFGESETKSLIQVRSKEITGKRTPPPDFSVPPTLVAQLDLRTVKSVDLTQLRQISWVDEQTLIGVISHNKNNTDSVVTITISIKEGAIAVQNVHSSSPNGKVLRLVHNSDTGSAFVELHDGRLYRYTFAVQDGKKVGSIGSLDLTFPSACHWVRSAIFGGLETVVGLDRRCKLYVGNKLVSGECNSFGFHHRFLIYTTLSNVIKFIRLAVPYEDTPSAPNKDPKSVSTVRDDSAREVERGSTIVGVVPFDTKVVLQMPRGNLEVIYPTILIVDQIRALLKVHDYNTSFIQMRKHRIDMNLFYDNNPQDFMSHLEDFVTQIDNPEYFNLFLSSLKDLDVTQSMYVDPETTPASSNNNNTTTGKVNLICEELRKVFQKVNPSKFLLPVLTTYVKKEPPQLEEVLQVVRAMREKEQEIDVTSLDAASSHKNVTAESALKYVCWIVDVNKLFDIALGMYDFDLVMMVAQRSQKDPKEYLPFLNELQSMEQFYRQYTIDMHLQRYPSALRNLVKAGDSHFDKQTQLIKDHKLYELGIELHRGGDKSKLNVILNMYGDYLSSQTNYSESGLVYTTCGEFEKALGAFKNAGDWELAFSTASKLNYAADDLSSLGYQLVETLKTASKHTEAAQILTDYCQDVEQAVVVLIEGHAWQEAVRKCHFHKRADLIETNVIPGAMEAYQTTLETIEKWSKKFNKKFTRLQIVKQNKLLMPVPDENNAADDSASVISGMSAISDMSAVSNMSAMSSMSAISMSTTSTGFTGRSTLSTSSKKKRKPTQQKRRITGKEGSPYEEEYLIEYLKRLFPTQRFQEDVGNLLRILLYFGHHERATKLQDQFAEYLVLVKSSFSALIPVSELRAKSSTNENEEESNKKPPKREKEFEMLLGKVDWKLNLRKL